jgi:predicted Fe-S protein YdhL (DUF1289 family)
VSSAAERHEAPRDDDARRKRRRERRRRARARQFDTSVPSPCIAVCELEESTNLCLGCRRHVDEIRDWPIMTVEEKKATLSRIDARKAADADGTATAADAEDPDST